jgi:hypothetical protein
VIWFNFLLFFVFCLILCILTNQLIKIPCQPYKDMNLPQKAVVQRKNRIKNIWLAQYLTKIIGINPNTLNSVHLHSLSIKLVCNIMPVYQLNSQLNDEM